MDFILKNSNASKSLLNQLTDIEMKQFEDFKNKEERFKNEENKILSSKNILSKDEYLKKVNIFKNDLNNYQNKKNEIINKFKLKRNNEIRDFMKSISPLINDFMTKNFIGILIEKKNIFIAKSNYDITESILEIINKEIKDYRISDDK
jgi:Skp family chaperone for outer membrane proteins